MDLNLEIGIDAALVSKKIGKDKLEGLKLSLLKKSEYTCECCKWQPAEYDTWRENENYINRILNYFVAHVDTSDPKKINQKDTVAICRSCFCIKHIEAAVKMGYVKFVNSKFDQSDLISISWSDFSQGKIVDTNRERAENKKIIFSLKKDSNFYVGQIKDGTSSDMLKVIFTDRFFDYNIRGEKVD